jgi:hypothetical protein
MVQGLLDIGEKVTFLFIHTHKELANRRLKVLASLAAMSILHITTRHESSTETYKATWKVIDEIPKRIGCKLVKEGLLIGRPAYTTPEIDRYSTARNDCAGSLFVLQGKQERKGLYQCSSSFFLPLQLPVRQKSQNTNLDTLKHAMTLFALTFPQVNFTLVDKKRKSRCMVTKKVNEMTAWEFFELINTL